MTDAERRYAQARANVRSKYVDPIEEFIQASHAMILEYRAKADSAHETMSQLRPVWAQGYTSDSVAAQSTGNALAELWHALGAQNQTEAMAAIRSLLVPPAA